MAGDVSSEPRRADAGLRGRAHAPRAHADPRVNSVRVGDVLADRYRIDEFVGAGGMASVFRATDAALGRTVAIKLFTPGTAGRGDAARQMSETRLLASLSHHALVTLFDAHLPEQGHAFLVMEYIDGGTLDSHLLGGPTAREDAASLARELGEALHVVHGAGIIHRDVKPSNILLRRALTPESFPRPTLADFGIAYLVDTTRLTAPGTAIGTAAYLAPEQVRGASPTTASDIYALGLVLIESLTGRRAFDQQTPVEAIAARLSMQPEIPASLGHGWRSLLTDMTTRDPERRPTALEVAARARALDAAPGEPDITALSVDPRGADTSVPPRPPLPAAPTAPEGLPSPLSPSATLIMPTEQLTDASLASSGSVPDSGGSEPERADSRPRRRSVLVAGGAVLLVAVIAAIIVGLVWNANAPADPVQPDLPQIGEPIDTHLRDLLDAVTP